MFAVEVNKRTNTNIKIFVKTNNYYRPSYYVILPRSYFYVDVKFISRYDTNNSSPIK